MTATRSITATTVLLLSSSISASATTAFSYYFKTSHGSYVRSAYRTMLFMVDKEYYDSDAFRDPADPKEQKRQIEVESYQHQKNFNLDEDEWGPIDFDAVDEFFIDLDSKEEEDDELKYINVDTDNAQELLQVLQEMIDNSAMDDDDDDDVEGLFYNYNYDDNVIDVRGLSPPQEQVAQIGEISKNNNHNGSDESNKTEHNFHEYPRFSRGFSLINNRGMQHLEQALMRGVVPAEAGVGSGILPGDIGFDPLKLAGKDYFKQVQNFLLNLLPERKNRMGTIEKSPQLVDKAEERPPALILRDYREAEIRHGRLAMLAAVIWPMQEIIDRIFIPEQFGSTTVIYGGITLPFLPLIMTFFMLNLGYLDVYSSEIKENESGDAFLPGECFWDPLCIMEGAPNRMKRNMQEREILNGRAAMIAVAAFIFEETMTRKPIITIEGNELLFEPVYQIPFIQLWLDQQFGSIVRLNVMP